MLGTVVHSSAISTSCIQWKTGRMNHDGCPVRMCVDLQPVHVWILQYYTDTYSDKPQAVLL